MPNKQIKRAYEQWKKEDYKSYLAFRDFNRKLKKKMNIINHYEITNTISDLEWLRNSNNDN